MKSNLQVTLFFLRSKAIFALCLLFLLSFGHAKAQCNRVADSLELVKLYNATNGSEWKQPWNLKQSINTWHGLILGSQGCVEAINLSNNQLVGSLPNLSLPFLKAINLSNNQLNGTIPVISSLYNLEVLNLSYNQLSGNIPNFNLFNLRQMLLNNNQLTGFIPNFILPELEQLDFCDNALSGNIPNFNLPKLKILNLCNNQLIGCVPNGIKTNCPLIGAMGGNIANNPNLKTQSWEKFWNNNDGACSTSYHNAAKTVNFSIAPNPTDDLLFLHWQMPFATAGIARLFDGQGRQLMQWTITAQDTQLSLRDLPNGIYILQVQTEDGSHSLPIAKIH